MDHEVSSTTPLFSDEVHHYQAGPDSELDQPNQDLFSLDDIVDLVGGAEDALNRHIAEDSAPHEFTETPLAYPEEPVTLAEPVHVTEPEPVSVPEVKEPEPEPEVGTAIPDSTSLPFVPDTSSVAGEPKVVAPKAEPESTKIEPEQPAAPEPEPAKESDALPVAEPRKAAPAPAEVPERPAVTEEPPAPASCECLNGEKNRINECRDEFSSIKAVKQVQFYQQYECNVAKRDFNGIFTSYQFNVTSERG